MCGAEEMPAGGDPLDCLDRQIVVTEAHRFQNLRPVAQQLCIHHDLLERGRQPPLEPARGVIDQVAVRENRRLQREGRLIGRLRIHHRRGVHRAGAHRELESPAELRAGQHRVHVLRRAEGG